MFLQRSKLARRTSLPSAKRQRGVAIITALLVVTIAATISVTISTRLQLDVRRTGNLITIDQGYYYALFAEDYSLTLIKDQEKFDVLVDNLREFGHFKQVFPVEGGTVEGKVTDLNSCININALVNGAAVDPATEERLKRLFSIAGVKGNPTQAITDWIDSGVTDSTTTPDGAEDGYYMNLEKPYRTGNSPLYSVSELRLVRGFEDNKNYDAMLRLSRNFSANEKSPAAPSLCALTTGSKSINVNTATAEVLQSLSSDMTPTIVENIIQQRIQSPYNNIDDFTSSSNLATIIKNTDHLVTESEYFLLRTKAEIGSANMIMYSIIYRDASGKAEVVYRTQRTL
jgi:general secretion pathway protein K